MIRIRVYPNPFLARDKFGNPCAVCPRDPDQDGGGGGLFVGAKLDRDATKVTQTLVKGDDLRSAQQVTFYKYLGVASTDPLLADKLAGSAPVEIPLTRYYRDRLREGSIIPADRASAEAARVFFRDPIKVFPPVVRAAAPAPAPAPVEASEPTLDQSSEPSSEGAETQTARHGRSARK